MFLNLNFNTCTSAVMKYSGWKEEEDIEECDESYAAVTLNDQLLPHFASKSLKNDPDEICFFLP